MADQQVAELMIGAACAAFGYCVGMTNSTRRSYVHPDWRGRRRWRAATEESIYRAMGPPPGPPPLKLRRSEEREPIKFEPGRVQRSNSGNPATIKPAIVPKPQPPIGRMTEP